MACIQLQSPDGSIRLIASGEAYTKSTGEIQLEAIAWDCYSSDINSSVSSDAQLVQEIQEATGLQLGDIVKAMIDTIPKSIRPQHCSACEQTRLVLNEISRLGVKETTKRVWDITKARLHRVK